MATKKTTRPESLIALAIESAPKLLAAGVTSLRLEADGGMTFTLAPPPPTQGPLPKAKEPPPQHIDPMKDAATYPGGRIPGFTREDDPFQ